MVGKNYKKKKCDGSDGKAMDERLKGPRFNPQLRQEKSEKYFLLFTVGCFGTYESYLQVYRACLIWQQWCHTTMVERFKEVKRSNKVKWLHEDERSNLTSLNGFKEVKFI